MMSPQGNSPGEVNPFLGNCVRFTDQMGGKQTSLWAGRNWEKSVALPTIGLTDVGVGLDRV
jgi:hypothetical protein